ncbi:bifunctional P-loop containing nucleoside triphosphate hydrolase/Small GTPase [Babesia duncani]|uniref:Bifunctional P-loop containing nucleoside triphosphate hydrolase/Small GTPase n=1 Tax=Babesia duncani TaxID=323732 RepID=A0AAD9PIR0_9APIC|nr:bifunctional P-loop containing nucleoside triphosphate hydrolase/Small GTPase [Babesia duncani]
MSENPVGIVGLPLLRVTLLGSHQSGKTSLANSLVNNTFCTVSGPTKLPELYYCVLRLSYDVPLVNESYDDVNAFCIEIEDTCVDGDLNGLLDTSKETWSIKETIRDYTPFSIYNPPRVPFKKGDAFKPITQGRMSFLVLFDVTSRESFNTAIKLVDCILVRYGRIGSTLPVVGLVANKVDLVPLDYQLFDEAETFAQLKTVPFYRVSARTSKNVTDMIKEVAFLIYGNVNLWEIEVQA